jgi:predicted MPP superfamily phosphohydrolase
MTGDMASRQGTDMLPLEFLMSSCSRICPVYYCLGNHEIDMDIQDYRHLMQTVRKSNVILLRNQSADIEIDNINLHITGLCFSRANFRNSKGGFTGLKPYLISDINEAVGIKENCFTVLLAHNPLYLDTYASWGAELVLSGHVHGGIIRLPFGKGLLSPERKFFPEYSAGIYKKDNTVMYVNSGLGKFRFFNPPEVTFIEFE